MVYEIAQWAGVTDVKDLKKLQFPISRTKAEWRNQMGWVECLPMEYMTAIEAVQPFQRGDGDEVLQGDLLLVLRELDNQDKHHLQMMPQIQPASIEHSHSVEFETEEGAAASVPPDTEIFDVPFRDGELLLRHRTKGRIAKVNGRIDIGAQVRVLLPGGRHEGVTHVLAALCLYTRVVMQHIAEASPSVTFEATKTASRFGVIFPR